MDIVILAGGGGTRLRPLSTADLPKPFLPLLPEGETLLQRTVRRLAGPELPDTSIWVVAAEAYAPLVRVQVPEATVLTEPEGRNTAAAIALATLGTDGADDEVIAILPADHRIDPAREGAFRGVLRAAAETLAHGAFGVASPLVTLGTSVTRPATEYGYLLPDVVRGGTVDGLSAYPLRAFEEKPARARAEALMREPGVAWNAGMFLWQRRAIREALHRYAAPVFDAVAAGLAGDDLAGAYARLPSRSIDYAVMEPAAAAGGVVMASLDVGWSDVGTWPALLEVLGVAGVEGGVVEAGEAVATGPDDLVVRRDARGGCLVGVPGPGTMTHDAPVAVLRDARAALGPVRALLARCAAAEVRA